MARNGNKTYIWLLMTSFIISHLQLLWLHHSQVGCLWDKGISSRARTPSHPSSSPHTADGDAVMWSPSTVGLLGARTGGHAGLAEWGLFVMVKRALPVCPVCLYPSDQVLKSGLFLSDDIIDILCALLLFVSSPKNGSFSARSSSTGD